jgi:hypothetical protein
VLLHEFLEEPSLVLAQRLARIEPQHPHPLDVSQGGIAGGSKAVVPGTLENARPERIGQGPGLVARTGVQHHDLVRDVADRNERLRQRLGSIAGNDRDRETNRQFQRAAHRAPSMARDSEKRLAEV